MKFEVNDGRRPDLLTLGLRATGELEREGDVPDEFRDALAQARLRTPPLDIGGLRDRARAVDPRPQSANRRRWGVWVGAPIALAAAAMVALLVPTDGIRGKGGGGPEVGGSPATLQAWVRRGNVSVEVGHDTVVHPGDRLRFAVHPNQWQSVVVINVDGTGAHTVFWPEEPADGPLRLLTDGPTLLDDSIELNNSAGPEAFVAVFDATDVETAEDRIMRAWLDDGLTGLEDLSLEAPDVALIIITKDPIVAKDPGAPHP
jgi:hypothetical protein